MHLFVSCQFSVFVGQVSCLFNLINWRSVSHKFAHFRNAQNDTKFAGCLPWQADKTVGRNGRHLGTPRAWTKLQLQLPVLTCPRSTYVSTPLANEKKWPRTVVDATRLDSILFYWNVYATFDTVFFLYATISLLCTWLASSFPYLFPFPFPFSFLSLWTWLQLTTYFNAIAFKSVGYALLLSVFLSPANPSCVAAIALRS